MSLKWNKSNKSIHTELKPSYREFLFLQVIEKSARKFQLKGGTRKWKYQNEIAIIPKES